MKTEDLINEIIVRAEEFCGINHHVLRDKRLKEQSERRKFEELSMKYGQ